MKERPILFNTEMVRAVLDGRKTQTRRIVKGLQPEHPLFDMRPSPYGKPGDELYVKETWAHVYYGVDCETGQCDTVEDMGTNEDMRQCCVVNYRADEKWADSDIEDRGFKWKSPRFMPRWASRIQLRITDVRVERVQEISDNDSLKEGISPREVAARGYQDARVAFKSLWNSINEKRGYGWDKNLWVWVVKFEVVK